MIISIGVQYDSFGQGFGKKGGSLLITLENFDVHLAVPKRFGKIIADTAPTCDHDIFDRIHI